MNDRATVIKEYYINLDYIQINKIAAERKMSILLEQVTNKYSNTLAERFYEVASVIKENWFFFASLCKHVDIVTTIIQYLIDIGGTIEMNLCIGNNYNVDKTRTLTFLTLYNVCPEVTVRSFLCAALALRIEDFFAIKYVEEQINEMILLEDSDLNAVVSCLRIIENHKLTKIWIHKKIIEKFLWLKMKYFRDSIFPINTFQSKVELITSDTSDTYDKITIVSIWSENILFAKYLAKYLNKNIVFINTHMDFLDGLVFIPYIKMIESMVHTASKILNSSDNFVPKLSENKIYITCDSKMITSSIYDLFYDGEWQKSTETTYYKHDNSLWANATKDDIQKCVISAQKGFEIWKNQYSEIRRNILKNLIDVLTCYGIL
ncbi:uncharacterized protein [Linepithema humile]|uniref:uncharacterized protein isoform X2 n=1 Tax=Linepithema humile TaxID=83485 RepID=UPI0006232B62|nr:PREDICTED: uncharacterized protein LOC105671205 isoform X2 [Linepithema humile]